MSTLGRFLRRSTILAPALALLGLTAAAVPDAFARHGTGTAPDPTVTLNPVHPVPAFRITGRVTDGETGRPLPGVQVVVEGRNVGAVTDPDGRYTLTLPDHLARSMLSIGVVRAGYGPLRRQIVPADRMTGGVVTVDFQLSPDGARPEEIASDLAVPGAHRRTDGSAAPVATGAMAEALSYTSGSATAIRQHPFPPHEREQYAFIEENGFRSPATAPLSTFSIDVDRASHSNVRRFLLREHRLPPVDAVQLEEMINYFPYHYDRPEAGTPLAVTTEMGPAPWAPDHRLLRIGVASTPIDTEELPPSNLVFLLDVSGSMNAPDKLPLVKRSMRLLVNQMREEDYVSIVVYAGAAGVVLEPTSGARKERILEAIERLSAGGSTAGGAGIRLAYDLARRHFRPDGNNRVILATDGDFNIGESSDAAMVRLVEERRGEGTFLTVLGFGTGNLQNTKMQEMAQHGNGNYAYIDSLDEARKVLVGEMGGTLLTVASDVKIQVEFNPERVAAYRLIGYENRLLADEDFNDDTKDAGELGAGHTVTALYEIVPVGVESPVSTSSVDPLRYQRPEPTGRRRERRRDRAGQATDELVFVKVRYKSPGEDESRLLTHPVRDTGSDALSTDLRFASAVAGFGMLLRESEYVNDFTSEDALRLAISGMGDDPGGYRHAFLQMIYAYQEITGVESTDPDRDRPWDVR